jgi:hypothetical protein
MAGINLDSDLAPDGWFVRASNIAGAEKRLDEYVVCRIGGAGGLHYRARSGPEIAENESDRVQVRCPKGTTVIGGGAQGGPPGAFINTSAPLDLGDDDSLPDDGWVVRVKNSGLTTTNISASATCAGPNVGDFVYRKDRDAPDLNGVSHPIAECPPGTAVSGGGFSAEGPIPSAWINSSRPYDLNGNGTPSEAWEVYAYKKSAGASKFTAHAICKV